MSAILFKNFIWLGEQSPRWVYCENGRIIVSDFIKNPPPKHSQAKVIDLEGANLAPALIDSHIHVHMLGEKKLRLDLSTAQNKSDLLTKLSDWRKKNPQAKHLLAFGWNNNIWSNTDLPNFSDLENALGADTVAILTKIDGHAALASRAAFEAAKIALPHSPLVLETEYENLRAQLPPPSEKYYADALEIAQKELFSLGIGAAHESAANQSLLKSFKSASDEKRLKIFIAAAQYPDKKEKLLPAGEAWSLENRYWLYGRKFFLDGSFGSRTAANHKAYLDTDTIAPCLLEADALITALNETIEANLVPLIHAIGDRAVEVALAAFLQIPTQPHSRLRLEHAELFTPQAAALAKKISNLVMGIQPLHAHSDFQLLQKILPESVWKYLSPWKSQQESAILCGGSDAPMDKSSPFLGMAMACAHPIFNEQSLTRREAFDLYCKNSFFTLNTAPLWGELIPGQWANFITLDRDLLLCELSDLANTKVFAMYLGGEKM